MSEIPVFGPEVDPLIARGILLNRLHDDLVFLDSQRFADLLANPVKPRVIRPARNRVHSAVVEDPYRQASPSGPVSPAVGPLAVGSTAEGGFRATSDPSKTICKCGMGYQGVPHPCMRWHHKMMTPEAIKDFTEVVKKHAGGYIPEPTLSLDLLSPDTQAYIANVVNPKPQGQNERPTLVAFMPNVMQKFLKVFRDDDGNRLVLTLNPHPSPYGVTDLVLTISEDPEWVKSFAKKHEEKHYTMPICCATPDPRIAKSGRSYCHSCKKYLDKVPPPQEQTITITRPKQEVQK